VKSFDDVPETSPYFNQINVLKLWGVTNGCSLTPARYCPSETMSRAQMAASIVRSIYGEDFTYNPIPYFTDVPGTSIYFKYVQKMKELGITVGCGDQLYCPDQPTTRLDAARFIIRAKMGPLWGDQFTYPATPYFTDVPATHPDFKYVQKFRELGYTNGYGVATIYAPNEPMKREQMATFLVRAFLN
jgi:hypothetical protein